MATTTTTSVAFTLPALVLPSRVFAPSQAATPLGIVLTDGDAPLTVTIRALPNNGTVTLADGTTALAVGQVLTAAQLSGLEFAASAAAPNTVSALQLTASDPAGNTASGTVQTFVAPTGTVSLAGGHAQYAIAPTGQGAGGVVVGPDGTQALSGLTDLTLGDGVGVFDASGNAGEVARILLATGGTFSPLTLHGVNDQAGRMDSGALTLAQVAEDDADSSVTLRLGGLRPANNQQFVDNLYARVLGRSADAAGEKFWTSQLAAGVTRGQALLGFTDSPENKANTAATIGDTHRSEAYRLYQAAFDRTPDSQGLDFWTQSLDAGATPLTVAQGFVSSAEFARDFTSTDHATIVAQLYDNVLHRAPDVGGQQYWVGQLDARGSLAGVLLGFSDSAENRVATAGTTHDGTVFISNS